jgi:hypothetical protein
VHFVWIFLELFLLPGLIYAAQVYAVLVDICEVCA